MISALLGEVADVNPRADSISPDEKVSFVGMAELDAVRAQALPRETRPFMEVSKGYTVFRDGDILAAKITPCWENGKVAQASLDRPTGVGSTEFHVLRPGPSLDGRYLLHFLRHPNTRATGELRMTGSAGQRRVPTAFLSELTIPLPPLLQQRRIAAILDHADALRAKRREVIAHLDTLTQSIFVDMFGAMAPDGTVGDVAEVQSGLQVTPKRKSLPIEVPYLRVANAHRGRLDLAEVKMLRGTDVEVERTRLHPGDLLFVEGHASPQEVGRVALWNGEIEGCVHQNHLIRARLDQTRILPTFAAAWLNTDRGAAHFRRAGRTTSGLNTISTSTVRSAPMPMAPIEAQQRFQARVDLVDAHRRHVRDALLVDNELFASLQFRAFRGKL